MIQVITGPELHGEAPSDQIFGEATEYEGTIGEQTRSAFLIEMTIAEHWGVRFKVSKATRSTLDHRLLDGVRTAEDPN